MTWHVAHEWQGHIGQCYVSTGETPVLLNKDGQEQADG
jgi:hypothetical protein